MGYDEQYRASIDDPSGFWAEAAKAVDWMERPSQVLTKVDDNHYRWFADGVLNTCANAVDRHVAAGRADQAAIVYDSPVTGVTRTLTYGELRDQVARAAGALAALGVAKGDTVIVYMPMVPEAVVAMLACARLGAIHSVVFGGFAPNELAIRIDDAKPRVIVTASCGIEGPRVIEYKPMLDLAIAAAEHKPSACLVLQREGATVSGTPLPLATMIDGRDHDWRAAVEAPYRWRPCRWPAPIRCTSSTHRAPPVSRKAWCATTAATRWRCAGACRTSTTRIPARCSGPRAMSAGCVGHSYIVYAPLLTGCTTILYEGKPVGTPDPGAFWRVIQDHGVKTLFTAPTAFRAIKKEDPDGTHLTRYDLAAFRYLFLAGERLDPDTYHWASRLLDRPVIDHWWQTESGWPIAANCMGIEALPVKAGSPTKPVPGYRVKVFDPASGEEVARRTPRARWRSNCRCRRARCRRCGTTTAVSSRATSPPTRATTSRATAAISTATATCT